MNFNDGCDAWFDVDQPPPPAPPMRVYGRTRQGALARFEAEAGFAPKQIIAEATHRSTGIAVAMVVIK